MYFLLKIGDFPASGMLVYEEGNLTLLFWEGNLFLDGVVFLGGLKKKDFQWMYMSRIKCK